MCLGVRVNQGSVDRNIKENVWESVSLPLTTTSIFFSGVWLWSPASAQSLGCLRSRLVQAPCWAHAAWDGSYLLDIHYQTLFAPFICSLSAPLNINYRGTLQLDISSFTLYLKQHDATSKNFSCLWCCRKKELQRSTKNQCNFLESCFIHPLPLEVCGVCLWKSRQTLCGMEKLDFTEMRQKQN